MIMREFNPTPQNCLGFGKLIREGNEFFLTDIESVCAEFDDLIKPMTPAIGGKVFRDEWQTTRINDMRNKDNSGETTKRFVTGFSIEYIAMVAARNVDDRIKSVQEQLYGTLPEEADDSKIHKSSQSRIHSY